MKSMSERDAIVLADLRSGEKAYPIYRVVARWSEADKPDTPRDMSPCSYEDLPAGYHWDTMSWYTMERRERCVDEILADLQYTWWPEYAKRRRDPADLTITVELYGRDVWCPGWFSHWTFDVGLPDIEVLASFEWYVDRVLRRFEMSESETNGLLMGAEDRWRWSGREDGDLRSAKTEPPCHCPACKKQERVRIDH